MSARKVRAEHQQHEDSVRQRGYWGFLLSLLTATSDDKLLTTSLVQIDTRIPGSGCSLGGRLNDSEKVRVSTLDADAALCRPLTQKIQISLFIVSSSCLDTWDPRMVRASWTSRLYVGRPSRRRWAESAILAKTCRILPVDAGT